MLTVTILGCGGSAGVPMIGGADGRGDWGVCDPAEPRNRRTRASIVIESEDGQRLLVDTSPDMRGQLIACGIGRIDAVLFTHAHADHITGFDDLRILNRIVGRPIEAHGTKATLDEIRRRFDYAFLPWKPPYFYRPVLECREFAFGGTVHAAGLDLAVFEQDHFVTKTVGLRVGDFAYSTDVVGLDEAAFATLAGVDTWVVGCFQRGKHSSHANMETVLGWSARVGARRTVLTHMGTDLDWGWLERKLPAGIEPAFDGMVLAVG